MDNSKRDITILRMKNFIGRIVLIVISLWKSFFEIKEFLKQLFQKCPQDILAAANIMDASHSQLDAISLENNGLKSSES